jgi:hypothetical protein
VPGADIYKIYPIPSSFLSISQTPMSILEKANHFLPKSFSDAPNYIQLSAVSDQHSRLPPARPV